MEAYSCVHGLIFFIFLWFYFLIGTLKPLCFSTNLLSATSIESVFSNNYSSSNFVSEHVIKIIILCAMLRKD